MFGAILNQFFHSLTEQGDWLHGFVSRYRHRRPTGYWLQPDLRNLVRAWYAQTDVAQGLLPSTDTGEQVVKSLRGALRYTFPA